MKRKRVKKNTPTRHSRARGSPAFLKLFSWVPACAGITLGRLWTCVMSSLCKTKKVKIIVVSGVGNSGKSSSIRKFRENLGVFLNSHIDPPIVLPINIKNKNIIIGIASGGDTAAVVTNAFNFFNGKNCDVIVCACKSSGESKDQVDTEINNLITQLGQNNVERLDVKTEKLLNPNQDDVADAILKGI